MVIVDTVLVKVKGDYNMKLRKLFSLILTLVLLAAVVVPVSAAGMEDDNLVQVEEITSNG